MFLRIKELRKKNNMAQGYAASKMGVSQSVLANWEKEVVLPRTRDLPKLAEVLGCTIDELFEDDAAKPATE